MENIKEIYFNLTGIDIIEQEKLWNERGKGYFGEYLVFCELYQKLSGTCKILMNLELPTINNNFTEIDLLLIHETGLYVFEVKHYKGTIFGKSIDEYWTQYFRSSSNHRFFNPISQNRYHISAIYNRYPDIPIYSYIVFTNPDCFLQLEGREPNTTVCRLDNLINNLEEAFKRNSLVFDLSQINVLFCDLKSFSPFSEKFIETNDKIVPFYDYLGAIKENFNNEIAKSKKTLNLCLEQNDKDLRVSQLFLVGFGFLCAFLSFMCFCFSSSYFNEQATKAEENVAIAQQELASFAQKFEHVEDFNNGEITVSKDFIIVNNVILEKSKDLANTLNFSCTLTWSGENYYVAIGEEAQIIVILKDGSVKEYDLWNEIFPFRSTKFLGKSIYKTAKIEVHEFYNIEINDISYIKLSNLSLRTKINYSEHVVSDDYEIELYRKEN